MRLQRSLYSLTQVHMSPKGPYNHSSLKGRAHMLKPEGQLTCARECSPRPLTTASLRAASSGLGASATSALRAHSSQAAMDTTATPTVSDCRSSFSVPFLHDSAAAGRLPFLLPGSNRQSTVNQHASLEVHALPVS